MDSPFIAIERDGNGIKNMNLSPLMRGVAETQITTIEYAYQSVPWLYRGATLIAQAISAVPYTILNAETGEAIEEDERLASLNDWMVTTLYNAALSRTLYGSAYFLIEQNPFGYNHTPRFIPSPAVTVNWNYTEAEIRNFQLSLTGKSQTVEPKRMMWSWLPNPFSETEPGVAPAYVALQAAGMLAALDQMASRYFRSGAVPITAVKVPPSTPKDDKEKLEGWFSRMATGFRNVGKFLAVNKDTEFQTIGANVKDTQAFELTSVQRDNVAVALGVPPTVLDGKSANFATANSEMMGFYLHTVIPNCEQISEHFNMRLFSRYGLEFAFEPEKLEIMQSAQLEQAQTLMELTGGKAVLSRASAQEWLGLDAAEEAKRIEAESETPATAEGGTTADVQGTALNGAQVTSLMDIVTKVASKEINENSARAIIRAAFPLIDDQTIAAILDTSGVKPPAPKPSPFGGGAQSTADNAAVPDDVDTEAETPEPEAIEAEEPPDDERMKAWREQALTLFRAGSPVAVGTPFDAELLAASSAKLIRTVFDTHWPKPHAVPTDWRAEAVKELARYNALAQGATV